jgi:predicted DNA-binding protein (MmcQ/YjbR family)
MAMKASSYDQMLAEVRSICLALPETTEVEAWGHPTFRAGKKMFAAFGELEGVLSLGLKVGFDRQEELLKDDRFFHTPYAAHQGWVSLRIDGDIDWNEMRGLLLQAYRQVALRRMLKALAAGPGPAEITDEVVRRIRALLDRMAQSRDWPNEYREEASDDAVSEINKMPRTKALLEALDRAVGRSKRRLRESIYLLAAMTDVEGVAERIAIWLNEGDSEARACLIQTIGTDGLVQFAEYLNTAMREDPDENCREFAVLAAGRLRCEVNLPVLLELTRQRPPSKYSRLPWNLLWALKEFGRPEGRPYLERVFSGLKEASEDRVVAAWGLCKLGPHAEAREFLVGLLGEKWRDSGSGYFPAVSIRAAQALCDVYGWPFEWGQEGVQTAREGLAVEG